MDSEAILDIVIRAKDQASDTIENVGKKAGGLSEMLAGSFKNAAIVSGAALVGLGAAAVESVKAFSDHQSIIAQTEAVLKSTSAEYAKAGTAVKEHTVTVGISTTQHAALQKQLDAANYSLSIAQDRWDAAKTHTKAATDELQHTKDKITELNAEMGKTTTVMAGGDGLIHATQITTDQVEMLSEALQSQTTYSKDATLGAENMLLTFTSIGKDIFPQATKTVLDVSTAMHEDLQSASIQVGKALQDPATGMSALHRIGVNFTKSQIETAKQMEATGNVAGAQAMILKELGNEFGGSAAAQAGTFAGKMAQLKNVMEDVQIAFGEIITKVLEPILPKFITFATILADWVENGDDAASVAKSLSLQLGGFGTVLGKVIVFFANNRAALIALGGAFAGILSIAIIAAVAAMVSFIAVSLPVLAIFAAVGAGIALVITNWKLFAPYFSEAMPIVKELWVMILQFVDDAKKTITDFVNKNMSTFKAFWVDVVGAFQFSLGFISGFWNTTWRSIAQMLVDIWQVMKGVIEIAWGVITIFIDVAMGIFTGNWTKAWTGIKQGLGYIWDGIKDVVQGGVDYIIDSVKTALNAVVGLINGVIDGFNKVSGTMSGNHVKLPELPHFQDGGFVPSTGLAVVHQGEFVLSKAMLSGQQGIPSQVMSSSTNNNTPINIYATVNSTIDMNLLGNRIAFALRNSR